MAKNKIPSVEPVVTPEEKAELLLAEYAQVVEEKKAVEERRKLLESELIKLAEQNDKKWFISSGTATFEAGKMAKVTTTEFVEGEAMNWGKFMKKYPTCVKFSFVTKSLKEFHAAEGKKLKKAFGIEEKTKTTYKFS